MMTKIINVLKEYKYFVILSLGLAMDIDFEIFFNFSLNVSFVLKFSAIVYAGYQICKQFIVKNTLKSSN